MIITFPDIIGLIGVIVSFIPYLLCQFDKMDAKDWRYAGINIIGTLLILYSLMYNFNIAVIVLDLIWLGICFVTMVIGLKREKKL